MNKVKLKYINSIVDRIWTEYNLEPGFDMPSLVRSEGIEYLEMEFKDNVSGLLMIEGDKKFICINQNEMPQRQRFSAGHELGHYFLHKGNSLSVNKQEILFFRDEISSTGNIKQEVEANFFSATLLMPAFSIDRLIDHSQTIEKNVENLSRIYDVSSSAMAIRLNNLGYN